MGTQSTQIVTKKEAINLITNHFNKVIERKLQGFNAAQLERLLDKYVEDDFTNYTVEWDSSDYDSYDNKDYSFIDKMLNV